MFTNDLDDGTASCYVLSKFADGPRLRGMVDMLKKGAALQRDLDKPEKGADENLQEFSIGECQVQFGLPRSS